MRNLAFYLAFGGAAFVYGLTFDAQAPVVEAQPQQLAISTTALRTGRVGGAYTSTVAADGGTKPYKFTASGLPKGLSINSETGVISGKPAAGTAGDPEVGFKVTDSAKPTAHAA